MSVVSSSELICSDSNNQDDEDRDDSNGNYPIGSHPANRISQVQCTMHH